MWQFELTEAHDEGDYSAGWHNFLPQASVNSVHTVESVWQLHQAWGGQSGIEEVRSGRKWRYKIEFLDSSDAKVDPSVHAGHQTNTSEGSLHTRRRIRRVPAANKCTCNNCQGAIASQIVRPTTAPPSTAPSPPPSPPASPLPSPLPSPPARPSLPQPVCPEGSMSTRSLSSKVHRCQQAARSLMPLPRVA